MNCLCFLISLFLSCGVPHFRAPPSIEPEPEIVLAALNQIENQFSGQFFEFTFGAPETVGQTTFRVWNPADGRSRRLEQQTETLPGRGIASISHYCQLHSKNHYVEATWHGFPAGATGPDGTLLTSQKPILRVYDAQADPFLLPEPIALCEQRCPLDVVKLADVIQASPEASTVKPAVDDSAFDWTLTCQSAVYGTYTLGFNLANNKAVIQSIEVVKSLGHEVLDAVSGPYQVHVIGEPTAGTYAGLQVIRFTASKLQYDTGGISEWQQVVSMKFENMPVPAGDGAYLPASLKSCQPLTERLSGLIEFESFDESEIAIVNVPSDRNMVYGIRNGKLVKLIDGSADRIAGPAG